MKEVRHLKTIESILIMGLKNEEIKQFIKKLMLHLVAQSFKKVLSILNIRNYNEKITEIGD